MSCYTSMKEESINIVKMVVTVAMKLKLGEEGRKATLCLIMREHDQVVLKPADMLSWSAKGSEFSLRCL